MRENNQACLSINKLRAFLTRSLRQLAAWVYGKTKKTVTKSKEYTDLRSLPPRTPCTIFYDSLFPVSVFPTTMATLTTNSNPALPSFSVNKESFPLTNLSPSPVSTLCTEGTFPSILPTITEDLNHAKFAKKFKKSAILVPHSPPTLHGSPVSLCMKETESTDQLDSANTFSSVSDDSERNEESARRITEEMEVVELVQMKRTLNIVFYKPDRTRAQILDLAWCEAANFLKKGNGSDHSLRWNVVKLLKANHCDVGLCKAITNNVGDQEYIDVLMPPKRYIVDTVFKERFQIARPSHSYLQLFQKLPTVFVGSFEEITMMVQIMCRAIEISMKDMGLQSPPHYRQFHYVMTTWTASYERKIVPPPRFGGSKTPPSDWAQRLRVERELAIHEREENFKSIKGFDIPSTSCN